MPSDRIPAITILPPTLHLASTDTSTAAELLAERERVSLIWATRIRMGFCLFASLLTLFVAGRRSEAIVLGLLFLLFFLLQLFLLRRLMASARADHVGLFGTLADVAILCTLPVIWHVIYSNEFTPLLHLSKHNLTATSLALITVNGLALRPLNPIVMTVAAVALHVFLALVGIFDSRLGGSSQALLEALGDGMSALDLAFVTPVIIAIAGAFVALAAHAARSTVHEAVGREHAEGQLRQQQLELVLEAKMAAVSDLVAGVEHEVNNPLGAMRSSTDTGTRAVSRIRQELETVITEPPASLLRSLAND